MLRNGGELGCRTKENQGFYLDDFKADGKLQRGLLTLFNELADKPEQEDFEYHLSSINTKYGTARKLYIKRYHLELMKRYHEKERPQTSSKHLLVSNSRNNRGEVISKRFGTDVFRKLPK